MTTRAVGELLWANNRQFHEAANAYRVTVHCRARRDPWTAACEFRISETHSRSVERMSVPSLNRLGLPTEYCGTDSSATTVLATARLATLTATYLCLLGRWEICDMEKGSVGNQLRHGRRRAPGVLLVGERRTSR